MPSQLLIIEPNHKLQQPFCFIDQKVWQITRISSLPELELVVTKQSFDLAMLSCSFKAPKSLAILSLLNQQQLKRVLALVFVVDFSKRYNLVLCTKWAKQVSILSSEATADETASTLARFL